MDIKYIKDQSGNTVLPITHFTAVKDNNGNNLETVLNTIKINAATYHNYPAASGGTDDSLVTTGDKYNWNNKVDAATTLAGYGITDAKIENGVITLGSATITPLTSHQSLTNHAKLADTSTVGQVLVSKNGGYEWKTLGDNAFNSTSFTTNVGTITSVGNTSSGAVTVSSSNNTASWGSAVTVGNVGGVDLKFTMPSNPDTAPVSSVAGNTGAVTAEQIATALTSAGYKLTDTDTNTTYSAGTALSLSGTTFNHSDYATAGTAGTSSATSGSTLAVPYVTVNALGHVTGYGTHTHTVSGFLTSHQDISGKQNKIAVNSSAGTTGTVSLACDTMYNIGTLTGNITFDLTAAPSDGYMHEWMFSFDVGSTAYTVTMPSGVTFPSSVSIAANKHYEVNIKGTYGLIASW